MFVLATCSTVNLSTATGTSMRVVYALVQSPRETPLRLFGDRLAFLISMLFDLGIAEKNPGLTWDVYFRNIVGSVTGLEFAGLITLNSSIDPRVPVSMGGITNILLTCLTAGRIWHIRRETKPLTGKSSQKRFDTAIAIIFESGVLYSLCVIIYVISTSINNGSASGTVFNGVAWAMAQIGVNIVPTLILVRVGMGRSTENTLPTTLGSDFKV
ncbi:hypothetical protein B0H13DRAFT_2329811 [Mycena leptocephala]|nr:hypothetical protein B0H13DRAFT_2329811 [Mycena leptocephala]